MGQVVSREPGFILFGAQRCGTTTFYESLCSHPDIVKADSREVHFFDVRYDKGYSWYLSTTWPRTNGMRGESSPYYIAVPYVPARIYKHAPDVKLVVLLRNPVDRALSQYWHSARVWGETRSFQKAIDEELDNLGDYKKRLFEMAEEGGMIRWHYHIHHSYQVLGYYAEQLSWYLDLFPREQILVIRSEDYFSTPRKYLNEAVAHLGLLPYELDIAENPPLGRNYLHPIDVRGAAKREVGKPMSEDMRKRLIDHFKPHNERLRKLLGRDFEWDK